MKQRKHEIRIVTFRSVKESTYDLEGFAQWCDIPIIYTEHTGKHPHCKSIGWDPDVWIDDAPALIEHDDQPWSEEKLKTWRDSLQNLSPSASQSSSQLELPLELSASATLLHS